MRVPAVLWSGSAIFTDELTNAMSSSTNFDYDRRTLPTSAAYGTATCGNNQHPPIYSSTVDPPRAHRRYDLRQAAGVDGRRGREPSEAHGAGAGVHGYSIVARRRHVLGGHQPWSGADASAVCSPKRRTRFDNAVTGGRRGERTRRTLNLALLWSAQRASLDAGDKACAGV
jgi:hypothetical protein